MAAKKKSRDIEVRYTRKQFCDKLRRLADAIESRDAFRIQVGKERIYVSANAEFNVEHERSKDLEELEFQLKWKPEA
jgi:amphi-Trp domain-containing protein